MALLQDLIKQIDDPILRQRIMTEVNKLAKQQCHLVLGKFC